jgi:hypothetical protein
MLKLISILLGAVLTAVAFASGNAEHGYFLAALTGLVGFIVPAGGEDE